MATNVVEFNLPELEVPRRHANELLQCIMHTIIFHRALGNVIPKDVTIDDLDFIYTLCDNRAIEDQVLTSVSAFCKTLEQKGKISIIFEERKLDYFKYAKMVEWEKWAIPVRIVDRTDTAELMDSLSTRLSDQVREVVRLVNERGDHVPVFSSVHSVVTFPFKIQGEEDGSGGLISFFKGFTGSYRPWET